MSEQTTNLNGEWIGHYPGHFDEVIRIMQQSNHALAVKLTGDEFVPAGNVTWWADVQTGEGEGQIAEQEFCNPRFVRGKLTVINPQRIVFRWDNMGEVEYRKDD